MDDAPLSDFRETSNPPMWAGRDVDLAAQATSQDSRLRDDQTSFVATASLSPHRKREGSFPLRLACPGSRTAGGVPRQQSAIWTSNHSWNHVHPELEEMASQPHLKAAFITSIPSPRRTVRSSRQPLGPRDHRKRCGRLFRLSVRADQRFPGARLLPRQHTVIGAFTTSLNRSPNQPASGRFQVCLWRQLEDQGEPACTLAWPA